MSHVGQRSVVALLGHMWKTEATHLSRCHDATVGSSPLYQHGMVTQYHIAATRVSALLFIVVALFVDCRFDCLSLMATTCYAN